MTVWLECFETLATGAAVELEGDGAGELDDEADGDEVAAVVFVPAGERDVCGFDMILVAELVDGNGVLLSTGDLAMVAIVASPRFNLVPGSLQQSALLSPSQQYQSVSVLLHWAT